MPARISGGTPEVKDIGMRSWKPHPISADGEGVIGQGGNRGVGRARIRPSPCGRSIPPTCSYPPPPAPVTEHGAEQWATGIP